VVGLCVPDAEAERAERETGKVYGGFDGVAQAAVSAGADVVAVTAASEMVGPALRRLSWELANDDIALAVAPGLMEVAGPRLHIRPVAGLPLLHVEHPRLDGVSRLGKGAFDRVAAGAALVVLLPALLVIAALVRATSEGPALFRQPRVGQGGRTFVCLKFRTMVADAERRLHEVAHLNRHVEGPLFKIMHDPRVTPLGMFLRRYSLDELPQLFHVLTGRMSLVGPRPPLPDEVAAYTDEVRRRLLVKPGLTGLWQISGRSDLSWDESVRLDLRYVENWSFALDLLILKKTLSAVIRGTGAY
jgi:exopolysaccharide biosynthesis polyprenyl glycosylphosphotransferase